MAATILIIDDDSDYIESVQTVLESQGYAVSFALEGNKGFDLAKKMQPDCIILDVMMEHSSEGLEVAQKLLNEKKTADIPVILVTGIRKPQNLAASFAGDETWTNVRGTIEKPVKPEELLQVLAKILSSK